MHLNFDKSDLRPLIEQVVVEILAQLDVDRQQFSKLAYTEPEAAALLNVRRHVLRDARLRGEISGSRVGKRILYERDELLRFLRQQRQL
ncbi:MAG: helix-turn-helix domain-containing protein [Candidatus Paceibacterota bacterium]